MKTTILEPTTMKSKLFLSMFALTLLPVLAAAQTSIEHLFWCGMERNNQYSPMYLMSQRGLQGGGYYESCHSEVNNSVLPITLNHSKIRNPMPIVLRFTYDDIKYPVTYIPFTPYGIEKDFICIK